jgi:hypothetical protein
VSCERDEIHVRVLGMCGRHLGARHANNTCFAPKDNTQVDKSTQPHLMYVIVPVWCLVGALD